MPNESPNSFVAKVYDTINDEWRPLYKAPDATDTVQGDVYLSDATDSTLSADTGMTAATPAAVKAVNDNANTKIPNEPGSVSNSNLAPDSVTSDKIQNGTIKGEDIANDTITGDNIADGVVTGSHIANNTIINSNIVDGTITGDKLASGTISSDNIMDGTIQIVDLSEDIQNILENAGQLEVEPDRALISNADGTEVISSDITATELGYLDGATGNIQNQINTHTHLYAGSSTAGGVATSAYRFAVNGTLTGSVDWNWSDYLKSGVYLVSNASMTTSNNAPNGAYAFGFLLVYTNRVDASAGYQIHQTYITHAGAVYIRQSWDGGNTWNGWYKVYTERNKPTAADIGAASGDHDHNASDIVSGTLPIARGGTGSGTAVGARTNLSAMGAVLTNGYYGMIRPDGNTSDWIRTPQSGILPYDKGQNESGSALGTQTWPFTLMNSRKFVSQVPLSTRMTPGSGSASEVQHSSFSAIGSDGHTFGLLNAVHRERKLGTEGQNEQEGRNGFRIGSAYWVSDSTTYYNLFTLSLDPSGNRSYQLSDPATFRGYLGLGYLTGALPVANGGTGAVERYQAKKNLGIHTGTGDPTTVSGAQTGDIYIKY